MPFDEADAALDLSELEFDVDFDTAYVNTGSVHVGGDWSGGDLFRRCGLDPDGRYLGELTAFVIDGDLTVDGTLDLDAGAKESFALIVTGTLRAQVLTLDATMLFVVNGAQVSRLIDFTTTDGTLSIAGTTDCPLLICDEGDLNLHSTGYIVCRVHESRFDGGGPAPEPTITLSRAEVPALLLDGLYDENRWVDAERAVSWARAGRPLLRPVIGT
ncbi:hypothetical protein GCM10009558_032470 [Virgisporangium aurantiacum]